MPFRPFVQQVARAQAERKAQVAVHRLDDADDHGVIDVTKYQHGGGSGLLRQFPKYDRRLIPEIGANSFAESNQLGAEPVGQRVGSLDIALVFERGQQPGDDGPMQPEQPDQIGNRQTVGRVAQARRGCSVLGPASGTRGPTRRC